MQNNTFTLGVNYWPRKKAMYWWKDFDKSEVEKEFQEIKALHLQVARIFLFWEDFQPTPEKINDEAILNLGIVLDTAQEVGIKIMPTFFTGHMSGINFWPEWALTDKEDPEGIFRIANGEFTNKIGRDPYADPFMIEAAKKMIEAVCKKYPSHPAIYSWNFSNEPDLFYMPKSYADGAKWNEIVAKEVRKYSQLPISAGIHLSALDAYNGFRPDLLAPNNDFLSMHGYSIYYRLTEKNDPMNSDVVPLACLITEGLGKKQVLFEEFGYASSEKGDISEFVTVRRGTGQGTQYFADDQSGGKYYKEVLEKLAHCGAKGAFAWMFSDYDPSLWGKPPFNSLIHERFFGITRYDGTVKPSGEAMREFAQKVEQGNLPTRTIEPLHLNPDEYYKNPQENFDKLFHQFRGKI